MTENAKKLMKAMKENAVGKGKNPFGMSMGEMFEAIEELIQAGVIEEPYAGIPSYPKNGCVVME